MHGLLFQENPAPRFFISLQACAALAPLLRLSRDERCRFPCNGLLPALQDRQFSAVVIEFVKAEVPADNMEGPAVVEADMRGVACILPLRKPVKIIPSFRHDNQNSRFSEQ